MSGNLNVTTTVLDTEVQARLDGVTSSTSNTDLIKIYRASELYEAADYTIFAAEVQSRINAVTGSTTDTDLLKLAASIGKIGNTTQSDLQSALLAIADLPTNSDLETTLAPIVTNEGLTAALENSESNIINNMVSNSGVGDVISTVRSVTADGKTLLPLKPVRQKFDAAMQAAYPILSSQLEGGGHLEESNNGFFNSPVQGYEDYEHVVYRDEFGVLRYYYVNVSVSPNRIESHNGVSPAILLSLVNSDVVKDLKCTPDGQTIVVLCLAGNNIVYYVSFDKGATFTPRKVGPYIGSKSRGREQKIVLSPDGTQLKVVLVNDNNGRVDLMEWVDFRNAPEAYTTTVDLISRLQNAGWEGTAYESDMRVTAYPDGNFSIASDNAKKYAYTLDAGATFTVNNIVFPADKMSTKGNPAHSRILVSETNILEVLYIGGYADYIVAHSSDGCATCDIFYDRNYYFDLYKERYIGDLGNLKALKNTGASSTILTARYINGLFCAAITDDYFTVLDMTKATPYVVYHKLNSDSDGKTVTGIYQLAAVVSPVDTSGGTNLAILQSSSNPEGRIVFDIGTVTKEAKLLPACDVPLTKIVADAQP